MFGSGEKWRRERIGPINARDSTRTAPRDQTIGPAPRFHIYPYRTFRACLRTQVLPAQHSCDVRQLEPQCTGGEPYLGAVNFVKEPQQASGLLSSYSWSALRC